MRSEVTKEIEKAAGHISAGQRLRPRMGEMTDRQSLIDDLQQQHPKLLAMTNFVDFVGNSFLYRRRGHYEWIDY
jgi:hypothetical protein